jgi:hypothetical protein
MVMRTSAIGCATKVPVGPQVTGCFQGARPHAYFENIDARFASTAIP